MKKIIYSIIALMASMSMNAQVVKLYKGGTLVKEYSQDVVDNVEFVENTNSKEELPAGTEVTGTIMVNGESQRKAIGGTVSDYVDLGLPSETLWATHNLGATKASDYGCYLAWGELGTREEGYFKGVKFYQGDWNYSPENLKYLNQSSEWGPYTKYVSSTACGTKLDYIEDLESCDDPATQNWGEKWCVPSRWQIKELTTVCKWEWTKVDDVSGYLLTGTNGNTMFLPAAGYYKTGGSICVGENGYYWSTYAGKEYTNTITSLNFDNRSDYINSFRRYLGASVRPVRK